MKRKNMSMTTQIIIAVAAGLALGAALGEKIGLVKLFGDIFLRLIQMSVVVLIMGAVIESIANLDTRELGKLGFRIFFWFTVSTLAASAVGLGLGLLLRPGSGVSIVPAAAASLAEEKSVHEILLEFFPANIVSAMANSNMIQVIVFSLPFGVALGMLRSRKGGSPLLDLLREFNQAILLVVHMMMRLAPLGIASLMAYTTGAIGLRVVLPLAKFLLVFGLGTALHLALCVLVSALYCKANPFQVAKGLANMTIIAMTTTSSAISLPTKMQDSENKLGVSKRISGLVNPLGMTLNSNGLSMYLALACVTIIQIYGMPLDLASIVRVVALSSLACLGTVVVPGGGLVALTIIVPGLGLPVESIALLSGIDWFSGMFRTALNVDIDALVSMMVAKSAGELNPEALRGKREAKA